MTVEAHIYQCPCCGSSLQFDSQSGQMKCASCENTYPVDTLEQLREVDRVQDTPDEQLHWDMGSMQGESADERHLRAYSCPTCGSRMVLGDTEAATACPYCENPAVLPGVLTGQFKPEGIIPFKKSKKDAQEAFQRLCKGKKLLPKGFASDARLEKITGVYVPFWLFDCETDSDVTYRGTRVSTHRRGDYMITRTDHYQVRRGGDIDFSGVPVNSSTKLDDTLMEAVEPFDIQGAEAFSAAYLSGSQAERYDEKESDCVNRANARIRQSVQQVCRASALGYTTLTPVHTQIDMKHGKAKNVMMPVWLLNTKYKDKTYTFAMNGQTGRMVGDLPVDGKRACLWGAGIFAAVTLVGYLGSMVLYAMGVL